MSQLGSYFPVAQSEYGNDQNYSNNFFKKTAKSEFQQRYVGSKVTLMEVALVSFSVAPVTKHGAV